MAKEVYFPLLKCSFCDTFTRHRPVSHLRTREVLLGVPEAQSSFGYAHIHECVVCNTKRTYGFVERSPEGAG